MIEASTLTASSVSLVTASASAIPLLLSIMAMLVESALCVLTASTSVLQISSSICLNRSDKVDRPSWSGVRDFRDEAPVKETSEHKESRASGKKSRILLIRALQSCSLSWSSPLFMVPCSISFKIVRMNRNIRRVSFSMMLRRVLIIRLLSENIGTSISDDPRRVYCKECEISSEVE